MSYRELTQREATVLRTLTRGLLPHYVRMLRKSGVRYRDMAAALNCTESTVASIAAQGRPVVARQRVPVGFAGYLRQLRDEQDPDLNAVLAAAVERGWTYAALGEALGVSPQAARTRAVRGSSTQRSRGEYIPTPTTGAHDD
ncbi:hypothetical protein [Micromonospora profundi]|uniref:hypothetical protein n=1 Tax=Micromonospora profundi TaxID=1420889 RepID=UPI0036630E40